MKFIIFLKDNSFLLSIIPVIWLFILSLVRLATTSEFDRNIMTKDKRAWYNINFYSVIYLVMLIYFLFFAFSDISPPPKSLNIFIAIIFIIWIITIILILVHRNKFKKSGYSQPKSNKFKSYLLIISFYNIIGLIFVFGTFLADIFKESKDINDYLGNGFLALVTTGLIVVYINYLFTKFNYHQRYSYTYTLKLNDDREVYVLHKVDNTHLLLGNARSESDSNELYLYNLENQKYLTFGMRKEKIVK